MTDEQFVDRAHLILHHMALENKGWRGWIRRWVISHEPLRNDAARLLRDSGRGPYQHQTRQYVGDDA